MCFCPHIRDSFTWAWQGLLTQACFRRWGEKTPTKLCFLKNSRNIWIWCFLLPFVSSSVRLFQLFVLFFLRCFDFQGVIVDARPQLRVAAVPIDEHKVPAVEEADYLASVSHKNFVPRANKPTHGEYLKDQAKPQDERAFRAALVTLAIVVWHLSV